MDGKIRRKILLTAVIAAATGLLLPSIFGQPRIGNAGGDPWRNFIYDFQTLIAGFFAVGAAFVTFHQMQRFDARSEKRHEEQIKLALRPDVLRMQRANSPSVETMREWRDDMRRISSKWRPDHLQEDTIPARGTIIGLADGFEEEISRPTFQEATHLFSGKMTTLIEIILSEVHQKPSGTDDAAKLETWTYGILGWVDMFLEEFDQLYASYNRQAFI
ncbi:hypothetical protein [Rhizobium fabae]|uniref:Uncharacterized protein n=1 Tax=Rhizobium fabae TaxID=573179 RepID=A0A7W6BEM9_9HYPH|nr:hypothetical protein [Rhizobium fabae]MBB3916186.1 hypothetical protein [Rhizobium fabae]RUM11183.1 hypothetical protein EFB14_20180 [Rhizobium fabae]